MREKWTSPTVVFALQVQNLVKSNDCAEKGEQQMRAVLGLPQALRSRLKGRSPFGTCRQNIKQS